MSVLIDSPCRHCRMVDCHSDSECTDLGARLLREEREAKFTPRERLARLNAWLFRTVAMTGLDPHAVLVELRANAHKRAGVARSEKLTADAVDAWAVDQIRNLANGGLAVAV